MHLLRLWFLKTSWDWVKGLDPWPRENAATDHTRPSWQSLLGAALGNEVDVSLVVQLEKKIQGDI